MSGEARFPDCVARPEVRSKEGDRSFEIARVEKQRPTVIAGGNVLPVGLRLRLSERQRQIPIPKPFAARALLEIQPVRRPQYPRAELSDSVFAIRFGPIAAL